MRPGPARPSSAFCGFAKETVSHNRMKEAKMAKGRKSLVKRSTKKGKGGTAAKTKSKAKTISPKLKAVSKHKSTTKNKKKAVARKSAVETRLAPGPVQNSAPKPEPEVQLPVPPQSPDDIERQ
jgi:hypothetical protein